MAVLPAADRSQRLSWPCRRTARSRTLNAWPALMRPTNPHVGQAFEVPSTMWNNGIFEAARLVVSAEGGWGRCVIRMCGQRLVVVRRRSKASRRPRPRRAEHKEGGGTPPLPQPVLNSDPDPNLGPWWVNRTWVRFKVRHRVGPNPVNPSGPDRTRT